MSVNYRSLLSALACVAALCACSDDDDDVVAERADPNANFTAYKTFAFAEAQDGGTAAIPSGIAANLGTANDAVGAALVDQGLTEVALGDEPDVIAFSLTSTDDQSALYWSCIPGYWYGYWSWAYTPCSTVAPYYEEYTVGTLVVGLVDPALEKVVFGGVAGAIVDGTSDANDEINDAVNEMFDAYPADQTGAD